MSTNSDRGSSNEVFRKVEVKLGSIQASAKKISETPESRLKRALNPAAFATRQGDFNVAVVDAFKEAVTALQETITSQEIRLEQLERNLTELRELSAATETQLVEKIGQLSNGQGDLGRELRERIQHLLDEQRVCLRQLSLKTSEEAVLAERARRATELRVEEFARRLPERPA